MPQNFPIPPIFPQPDWIDALTLPQSPRVSSQMSSGHTSTLRISRVQTGASFAAQWHSLTELELLAFQIFWQTVDTWDVVKLPLGVYPAITGGFWPVGMGVDLANYYINASPTGWWRMRVPKIEPLGLTCQWMMTIEFEGVID